MMHFPVTRLVYANVYAGVAFEREMEPVFSASILAPELPEDLREFARQPRMVKDELLLTISAGRFSPVVSTAVMGTAEVLAGTSGSMVVESQDEALRAVSCLAAPCISR